MNDRLRVSRQSHLSMDGNLYEVGGRELFRRTNTIPGGAMPTLSGSVPCECGTALRDEPDSPQHANVEPDQVWFAAVSGPTPKATLPRLP